MGAQPADADTRVLGRAPAPRGAGDDRADHGASPSDGGRRTPRPRLCAVAGRGTPLAGGVRAQPDGGPERTHTPARTPAPRRRGTAARPRRAGTPRRVPHPPCPDTAQVRHDPGDRTRRPRAGGPTRSCRRSRTCSPRQHDHRSCPGRSEDRRGCRSTRRRPAPGPPPRGFGSTAGRSAARLGGAGDRAATAGRRAPAVRHRAHPPYCIRNRRSSVPSSSAMAALLVRAYLPTIMGHAPCGDATIRRLLAHAGGLRAETAWTATGATPHPSPNSCAANPSTLGAQRVLRRQMPVALEEFTAVFGPARRSDRVEPTSDGQCVE